MKRYLVKNKRSELRKCLYYLDEPDYKLDFLNLS